MRSEVRDVVRRWMGEDARILDGLSDEDLIELHGAVEAARRRQAEALAAASDQALRQMPALLRGSVSKILGS